MTEPNKTYHDKAKQNTAKHITEHPEQDNNITEQRAFGEYDKSQQHPTEHNKTEHEKGTTKRNERNIPSHNIAQQNMTHQTAQHNRTMYVTEHPKQNINTTEKRTFDEYDKTQHHSTDNDRTEHDNDRILQKRTEHIITPHSIPEQDRADITPQQNISHHITSTTYHQNNRKAHL